MRLFFVIYLLTGVVQFFAIYAFFSTAHDINGFLSFILALIMCQVPFLGTILGILGAHDGWEWGWFASIALYIWPYVYWLFYSLLKPESDQRPRY